ncbi:hypothetical protein [Tessaracoccus defluvii]|uniref:Uncharacterized protein n=1 Tax=Tessaracoccus defluvii TaxID=1285901 RepID=A0A7H0H354_9ACTN|nr:hypothetical protein [Tessaracoccus defluvii]QNP54970.1 hypothetical protein H9L22_11855 [Tessaracoccus defluvii]
MATDVMGDSPCGMRPTSTVGMAADTTSTHGAGSVRPPMMMMPSVLSGTRSAASAVGPTPGGTTVVEMWSPRSASRWQMATKVAAWPWNRGTATMTCTEPVRWADSDLAARFGW